MMGPSMLAQLLQADGRPHASPSDLDAWYTLVEHVAETLDVGPGTRIFDVSCGAGAFLLPLFENGYVVGGADASAANVDLARRAMPAGRFLTGRVAELDPADPWDVVLASRGFAGCKGADDVRGALARMTAKATHAVAVLAVRESGDTGDDPVLGRAWLLRELAALGATAVQFEDDGGGRYRLFARV